MAEDWRHRRNLPSRVRHPNSPADRTSDSSSSRAPRPDSPAGRYFDWSWVGLPHPHSPAGRHSDWQSELSKIEYPQREDLARQIQEVENCLAEQSDSLRESLPDDSLRTIYDRQVGQIKGAYSFGKSLGSTAPDLPSLLQKLQIALDWIDPQLLGPSNQRPGIGVAPGKTHTPLEYGTLTGKQELSEDLQALADRVYKAAKKSIQEQWAEAKRKGKQEELIEKWKARMLQHLAFTSSAGDTQQTRSEAVESETEPQRSARPPIRATSVKTWVEFRLIDQDGNPVSNAMYKVKLPDGAIMNGSLNEKGSVRFDNIDPGQCRITFTEIDAREWHPL